MSVKPRIALQVFRALNYLERAAAYAQGKGYGTATIDKEVKLIHQLLNGPPALAIDIGGNVGEYTAELRKAYSTLNIHVFEPSPANIQKLEKRFRNDANVVLVPLGVSDKTGSATLFADAPGSGLGSLTKRRLDHFNIGFEHRETIGTIRFEDYWISKLNRQHLDIVKMDIEGHELAALSGFGKALDSTSVIQFEFGGCNIDTRTYFQDFWYFFKDFDFDIYRITPLGLEHIRRYREGDEYFSTTNYIAANRKHR